MAAPCLIEFENVNGATYWAGQTVSGKVILTDDNVQQVEAITLKIKGCANTSWTEDTGMGDDKSTTTYSAHVDYIKSKICLFDNIQGFEIARDQVITEPGIHIFSFTCHIPPECPSSIEGLYGYIRYWVQVIFTYAWKFDKMYKKCFTVINLSDLNLKGDFRLPVKSDVTKTFCCGVFKSDPLKIMVQMPQAGYVPGQLIPVGISVTNDTSSSINEVCVRLLMMINYFCTVKNATTSETKTISMLKGDPVLRCCRKNFNYLLPVPATPPSCTSLCRFIHITYRVEVEAKMQSILHRNQCVRLPVTIGNVPLLQRQGMIVQQQPMQRQLNFENSASEMTIRNSATGKEQKLEDSTLSNENVEPWSAAGNISPPVYMEAVHIPRAKLSLDTDHEYGETSYVPKYPVFDFPIPTAPTLKPNQHGDGKDGHNTAPHSTTWMRKTLK